MEYFIQLLKLVSILSFFIFGAYIFMKKIKKQQLNKVSPNKMIQVIDGVQVGMKDEVVLMKVGTEYVLLSTNSGTMIPLNQKEIVSPSEDFDEMFAKNNPNIALKGLAKNFKDGLMKK